MPLGPAEGGVWALGRAGFACVRGEMFVRVGWVSGVEKGCGEDKGLCKNSSDWRG